MKKKIISILLIIVLLMGSLVVFATETPDEKEDVLVTTEAGVNNFTGNKILVDETVTLKDTQIDGNLIIFAQELELSNVSVNGDVAIFAQYIYISDLDVINGATVIAGQKIIVNMLTTAGNLYTAGEDVNITAYAKGLYVAAGNLILGTESQIQNVYNLEEVMPKEEIEKEVVSVSTADIVKEKIISIITIVVKAVFVCGFIFLFTPEFIEKIKTENIIKYIGFSALKGAGWTILIPIIVIAICMTGIGIGVGFATLALYIIIFWASVPFVSLAIMNVVAKEDDKKLKRYGLTLCIALAIAVLGKIPVLGGFVAIIVGFAGMGIVIGSLKK